MVSWRSVPSVTVVGCEATLLAGSVSMPRVGTPASTGNVPCWLVCTSACRLTTCPPLSAGMVQLTVVGPLAGTGAQPVMGLPATVPVKVKLAGMLRLSVFVGAVLDARSSFSTVMV